MSVVAPVAATSTVVPVLVGVAGGERPGWVAAAGIALALLGVVLASRSPASVPPVNHRLSVALAVATALFAGLQLVALQRAGSIDPMTGVAASRATSVLVILVLLLLSRPSAPVKMLPAAAAAVVGVLDTAAHFAYTFA